MIDIVYKKWLLYQTIQIIWKIKLTRIILPSRSFSFFIFGIKWLSYLQQAGPFRWSKSFTRQNVLDNPDKLRLFCVDDRDNLQKMIIVPDDPDHLQDKIDQDNLAIKRLFPLHVRQQMVVLFATGCPFQIIQIICKTKLSKTTLTNWRFSVWMVRTIVYRTRPSSLQ